MNYSNEITSRFTALSPEEQRGWVERAQTLLNNPAIKRHQIRGDYREIQGIDYDLLDANELLSLQTAFEDLFDPIIPTELIEEMTSVANAIMQKRPDMMTMDEGEVVDVLSGQLERLILQTASDGKTNSDSGMTLSDCEGLCGAVAGAAISATLIGYVSSMIKCSAAGPAYGLCAGMATAYKSAKLVSTGITLYACLNNCE
ncbi:MAG: hypothetical protein JJU02_17095 [Cryomorphaceae bacterium]|nr:hypothetical protein [Cryomorphaceae bacterium]